MILIVSALGGDDSAAHVAAELARRGHAFTWIDPADVPARLRVTLVREGDAVSWRLALPDRVVELSEVRAAWWWRPGRARIGEVADPFFRAYAEAETAHVLDDLWHSLPCRWVPGSPGAIRRAEYKFVHQQAAVRVGLAVPDTLVTNDPDQFFAFRERHPGAMICKPPGPSLQRMPDRRAAVAASLVSHGDLGHLAALRHAPVTFQPYVAKRSEVRVTVIGEQVHAVEIDSQATWRTRTDWRRFDLRHTPHRRHELPAGVARACVALVAALELRYGAIDLILTPGGDYVFLELNPNGQFGWLADRTGAPMVAALCDLLASLDAS